MSTALICIVLIFIILRFCVTLFNFVSHPKLLHYGHHFTDKVSILIPVRNEEHQILDLLTSIVHQDYENYEVLILDDDSSDDTYIKCSEFASKHPKFNIIKGEKLPKNWLGKNFACHQLASQASGKYFLFVDADETLKNGLIHNSIFRMKLNNLTLLSLFTTQKMLTWGEKTTVPLMHFILLNLLPLVLVRISSWSTFSAASGQMMFFDAQLYRENLWHQQVAEKVVEDIEIVKKVKNSSLKAEALLANKMLECRMYQGYNESIQGFSKNILAGFDNQIPALLIYLLLVTTGPIFLIYILPYHFLILPITLIILNRLMISYLADQNPIYNILLHPIQMFNLTYIGFLSIFKRIFKQNTWKGRRI